MGDNDFGEGITPDQGYTPDNSDAGNQGDQGGNSGDQGQGNQGNPEGQNGQPTDPREAELARARQEIRRLNKAIVEAKRGGQRQSFRTPSGQGNQGEQGQAFGTPEQQYVASLQIATNELRGKIEDVFDLYPEIPASELSRIRRNPWSFASLASYQSGDYESAMTEIEQYLYDRAEELGKGNGQNGSGGQKVTPARVPLNPSTPPAPPANPGSTEDVDPWTMPIDKLEKQVEKEKAKMRTKS